MLMLIDDILLLPPEEREQLNMALLEADVAEAYEISDVARFGLHHMLSELHAGTDSFVYATELPNVAPLGAAIWMEFDVGHLPDAPFLGTDIRTYGVMMVARDRREEPDEVAHWLRVVGHDPDDAIRWVVPMSVVWRFADNGEIASRQHFRLLAVRPDGSVQGMYRSPEAAGAPPLSETMETIYFFTTAVACLAVTFAHCHNVQTSEHQPSRQQRRFRERHGGPPLVTWRTIDVPGIERLLRTEGGLAERGLHKALHLVRANFAHYTEEAPLFGKLTGTFYRPQHVRGRDTERTAPHRYRVHPPSKEER
jgi:hypothetical protein